MVHYSDTNFLGRLHGGEMLKQLVDTGMLAAMKVSRSLAIIASLDEVELKKGINLGDIIILRAQVDYIGKSSMEVQIRAYRNDEEMVRATAAYVKVDDFLKPVPINEKIEPKDENERLIYEEALRRRLKRLEIIKDKELLRFSERSLIEGLRYRVSNLVYVSPELTYNGQIISAGKLLKLMDEVGGILALNFIGHPLNTEDNVVTVAISTTPFLTPVRLGEILEINSGLAYVGNTSITVLLDVVKIDPKTWRRERVTFSYFTYVRIDRNGKPRKVPEYTPITEEEKRLYFEILKKRKISNLV
jgi:acyl-CoA hydrolase